MFQQFQDFLKWRNLANEHHHANDEPSPSPARSPSPEACEEKKQISKESIGKYTAEEYLSKKPCEARKIFRVRILQIVQCIFISI